ncbi:MAG: CBS domain-containing protein [Actinomycetota bacterium]
MQIIVTHISSDFDAFAALIAAKKIYPKAHIILPTSINQNVRRFIALHEDELPRPRDAADMNLKKVSKMIIVDTRIPERLGPARAALANKGLEILLYDHHQETGKDVKSRNDYSRDVGAATSLLVKIIEEKNIEVTPLEATLFALGIYEDTGSFTYPSTTACDLEAAAYLLLRGANLYVLNKFHNISLSEDQHKLLETLIENTEKVVVKGKEVLLSHAQVGGYVEGLSVLTRKLSQIEDINTVICWARMKGKVYIVARSYDKSVDVSDVLEAVGGGGHPQAASAVAEARDFNSIRQKIISSLDKRIRRPQLASDIMSYPVRFVKEDESIQQVDQILKKYGHSGIPIVDRNQKLAGIITRKDIDKAIKHGLGHAPVKGFRSHGVVTAGPDSTIDNLQSLMIENGIGRIPIVHKGRIVGIVTRKDILRHLHGQDFDRKHKGLGEPEKIKSHFPPRIWEILKLVSEVSEKKGYRVYLVGGIVRDILLNIPNLDVDIVVEGDGIELARELQKRIGCRAETHHKFKTAVLVLSEDLHLDIATARVEYYESPAALPSVESGSIKQDLSRRDFTINAMAISLNEGSFGKVIDYFGGRKDLKNRKIKVLHKMSFIEDPTRIFRGVRFEQRLGFSIDPQTEKLIRTTIDMGMVSKLTGVRVRDELTAILNEENPWKPLKRLYELGALGKIGINVSIEEDFISQLKSVLLARKKLGPYTGKDIKKWRLLFIMLLKNQPLKKVKGWCREMKVKKKDAQLIADTVSAMDKAAKLLGERIKKNSELYRTARRFSGELLIICSTWGNGYRENTIKYLRKLKNINLEIDGDTLIEMGYKPSVRFREVLDRLFDLKLDGLIRTREEEISQAKRLFEAQGDRGGS